MDYHSPMLREPCAALCLHKSGYTKVLIVDNIGIKMVDKESKKSLEEKNPTLTLSSRCKGVPGCFKAS